MTINSTTERVFRDDPPNRLQDAVRAIAALPTLEQTVIPDEPKWFKDYCDEQLQQEDKQSWAGQLKPTPPTNVM